MSDLNTSTGIVTGTIETPAPETAKAPAKVTKAKTPRSLPADPMAAVKKAQQLADKLAADAKKIADARSMAAEELRKAKMLAGTSRGRGVTAIAKEIILAQPAVTGDALAILVNKALPAGTAKTKRSTTDTVRTDLLHTLRALSKFGALSDKGKAVMAKLAVRA